MWSFLGFGRLEKKREKENIGKRKVLRFWPKIGKVTRESFPLHFLFFIDCVFLAYISLTLWQRKFRSFYNLDFVTLLMKISL